VSSIFCLAFYSPCQVWATQSPNIYLAPLTDARIEGRVKLLRCRFGLSSLIIYIKGEKNVKFFIYPLDKPFYRSRKFQKSFDNHRKNQYI